MKTTFGLYPAALACVALLAACGASLVHASPDVERRVCVVQPGQPWLGEKKIKEIFGAQDYLRVDFKVSKNNCYEFYAIRKNGDVVEAYYHPVTGEIIQRNELKHTADMIDTTQGVAPAVGEPASAPR